MNKYFFMIREEQVGPLEESEISQRVESGVITRETMCWCEGMADWLAVKEVNDLSAKFPALSSAAATPPPLPKKAVTPPPCPGVKSTRTNRLNDQAYQFVTWLYRPWKGRPSPVHDYVQKDPQRALPVAAATVAVVVIMLLITFSTIFSAGQKEQSAGMTGPGQMAQPPAGWQQQYKAWKDQQSYTQKVLDDTYTYQRDSQDRMDDSYRRATYDWYGDK